MTTGPGTTTCKAMDFYLKPRTSPENHENKPWDARWNRREFPSHLIGWIEILENQHVVRVQVFNPERLQPN